MWRRGAGSKEGEGHRIRGERKRKGGQGEKGEGAALPCAFITLGIRCEFIMLAHEREQKLHYTP